MKLLNITGFALIGLIIVQSPVIYAGKPIIVSERVSDIKAQDTEMSQKLSSRSTDIQVQIQERNKTVKAEICERRKEKIAAIIPKLATNSDILIANLDNFYVRITSFYVTGQLFDIDYDRLQISVEESKAEAALAVATIKDYIFELDCNNANLGQQLDGYRTSINLAKESLRAYRTSLIDMTRSLRAVAADSTNGPEDE